MVAAVIGKNYTTSATFKNEDQTPFEVIQPINYKVYSFNNIFILENTATQDSKNPSIWYANFSIPEGSPVPNDINNEQYRIDWYAQGLTERLQASQQFQVIGTAEPPLYDSTVLALIGQPVVDQLLTMQPISRFSLILQDGEGNQKYTVTEDSPKSTLRNNTYITNFSSETPVPGVTDVCMGFIPFQLIYTIEYENGEKEFEIHNAYTVNAKAIALINNLRRYLDMVRNYDIIETLRLTEEDYIHFLTVGLQRINAANPNITNYTMCNYPMQFMYLWEMVSKWEILNSWFLAESMRSFNFTGASVTLDTTQRLSGIEKKMDEIGSWINDNLTKTKELMIRHSNTGGNLGVALTSVTNGYSPRYPGQLRGLYRRY